MHDRRPLLSAGQRARRGRSRVEEEPSGPSDYSADPVSRMMPELSVVPPAHAVAPKVQSEPDVARGESTFQEPYPICSGREKRRGERRVRALSRRTLDP